MSANLNSNPLHIPIENDRSQSQGDKNDGAIHQIPISSYSSDPSSMLHIDEPISQRRLSKMENINVQGLSSRGDASQEQQQQQQQQSDLSGGVGRTDLQNNISSNNTTDDDADSRDSNNNNKQDRGVGSREDHHGEDSDNDRDDPDADVDVDMIPQYNNIALQQQQQQQQQRPSSDIFVHAAAAANPSSSSSLPTFASLSSSISSSSSSTIAHPSPSHFLSSPTSLLSLSPLYSSSSSPSNPPVAINTAIASTSTLSNTTNTLAGSLVDPSSTSNSTMLTPHWDKNTTTRDSVQLHPLQSLPLLHFPFSTSSSASTSTDLHNYQAPRQPLHDTKNNSTNNNAHHQSEYQQQQDKDTNNNNGHASVSLLHTPQEAVVGLDASTTPTGTTRDELSASPTTPGSQANTVESASSSREQNTTTTGSRRIQQSSIDPSSSSLSPYPRDFTSSADSRRRQTWSLPSPPSKSRSLHDSSSTRPSSFYDNNNSIHLPPPSTLSPPTTASTLSSYPSSPYDTPSSATLAAAAAFKHISPFSSSLSPSMWPSPPGSHYATTPTLMSRQESFPPTSSSNSRTRPHSSLSPLSHTTDLPSESSHQYHSRSDSNQRHDNRFHPLYPAQQQPSTSASAGNSSLTTAMIEDRLSLHRLSPPGDLDGYSSSSNNNGRSRYSITSDKSLYESIPPLQQRHHHRSAAVEGSSSDRSRVSTSESTSQHPPPLQKVLSIASKDDSQNGNHNTPSSTQTMKHPKKWTSTESVYNRKVLSARGTPKGPLPMDVQISLLSSVLRHDPFNCPIRRTTQVWECISREQGVRARTCARRYDNIIQASIAGRERPVGTEEQIAIKKKLLDQLFVMMNQPQALVRMQKKKRYRSEEADRQLLLETIRLNPFAQKMGQVAKAWEDVRDALKMQVHARQCIRRVNRMIKPYQLRERMYHGSIPDDMKEENDELIKQVIQMMQASGQGGSLEDGEDDDDDSASDSDDQEETHRSRSRQSSDGSRGKGLGNGGDDVDESMRERRHHDTLKSSTAMDVSVSPRSPALSLVQSPQTVATTPTASELEATTSAQKRRPRNSSHSSMSNVRYTTSNKRSTVDRSSDEMDMTPPTSLRHHPFESEFKPQRLWGSHPYSKERSSRIVHGTHPQRPSSRSSSSLQSDPHRPAKYTRSSSRDPLRDTAEDSQDRSMVLQSSSSSSAFRTPTSESDSRQQYHYDHQHNIYSQSNLHHSHSHSSSGHQLMDGQVSISSAQQDHQQPATELYGAILGEFQVVQRYLGQVEDERKRDKERQTEMGFMMDKLQFQLQQQQQSIEDLQHQLQHQNQQSHPQQQQLQLQGQQQQEDHRRTSQQFDHSRRSHAGDSPSFSTLSMNVSDQQQK